MSSRFPEVGLTLRSLVVLGLLSLLSVGIYLLAAHGTYRIGFPLDDAWIHQVYARNLAHHGEWAFHPGQPSAGSTAPLWSMILSIGYTLGISLYVWTFSLGVVLLWALSLLAELLVRRTLPFYRSAIPWAGAFLALEWHLAWAAASGMETLMQGVVVVGAWVLLASERRFPLVLGLVVGTGLWVRPDAVTLLGPAVMVLTLSTKNWPERWRHLGLLMLGVGALFLPYVLFNLALDGSPLPNTFHAKQAEYAVLQDIPLFQRFLQQAGLPLIGAGLILAPGVFFFMLRSIRSRDWATLAMSLWLVGYFALYAWRLPVTYQHGRYAMPAMPVYFILGLCGFWACLNETRAGWRPMLAKAWRLSLSATLLVFFALGGRAYALDVAVIESEMIDTARWVNENLPEEALIAAHDIGGLGYFG
jgi:hypothetical protein